MAIRWYGAAGIKPTTLMYSNGNLPRSAHDLEDAVKPVTHLLGRASDGSFRTACAKEYPSVLSQAFAGFCSDSIARHKHRFGSDEGEADRLMMEFIQHCSSLESGTMMPDYQPLRGFEGLSMPWHEKELICQKNKLYIYIYIYIRICTHTYTDTEELPGMVTSAHFGWTECGCYYHHTVPGGFWEGVGLVVFLLDLLAQRAKHHGSMINQGVEWSIEMHRLFLMWKPDPLPIFGTKCRGLNGVLPRFAGAWQSWGCGRLSLELRWLNLPPEWSQTLTQIDELLGCWIPGMCKLQWYQSICWLYQLNHSLEFMILWCWIPLVLEANTMCGIPVVWWQNIPFLANQKCCLWSPHFGGNTLSRVSPQIFKLLNPIFWLLNNLNRSFWWVFPWFSSVFHGFFHGFFMIFFHGFSGFSPIFFNSQFFRSSGPARSWCWWSPHWHSRLRLCWRRWKGRWRMGAHWRSCWKEILGALDGTWGLVKLPRIYILGNKHHKHSFTNYDVVYRFGTRVLTHNHVCAVLKIVGLYIYRYIYIYIYILYIYIYI